MIITIALALYAGFPLLELEYNINPGRGQAATYGRQVPLSTWWPFSLPKS